MNTFLSHPIRSGLLAAGLLSCVLAPEAAGAMPVPPVAAPQSGIIQVRNSEAARPNPIWRRQNQNWRRGGGHWNNGNGHWRNNGWRYRNHGGYYGGPYYGGSGFLLGLGLGAFPGYNYYAAPRYYYRSASSAHVRWCYSRYRSYRASDNSWQPYHGPRRQCVSPY